MPSLLLPLSVRFFFSLLRLPLSLPAFLIFFFFGVIHSFRRFHLSIFHLVTLPFDQQLTPSVPYNSFLLSRVLFSLLFLCLEDFAYISIVISLSSPQLMLNYALRIDIPIYFPDIDPAVFVL